MRILLTFLPAIMKSKPQTVANFSLIHTCECCGLVSLTLIRGRQTIRLKQQLAKTYVRNIIGYKQNSMLFKLSKVIQYLRQSKFTT